MAARRGPGETDVTFNQLTMASGMTGRIGSLATMAVWVALMASATEADAQRGRYARSPARAAESPRDVRAESERQYDVPRSLPDDQTALHRGRFAVLVDLDENRLYFMEGKTVLWSAPVGTGTGMRVITDTDRWEFSTPTGNFEVQYKELDPVWIAPDWYFVENGLSVPPRNHPSRYMKGTLGAAAVYISPHLAIHGTNRPELIGQRVSHGCIRLENRYAMRLYHNVQVGTEVIIVGGEEIRRNAKTVDLRDGYDPSLASRGGRRSLPPDPVLERWKAMDTPRLLISLDRELMRSDRESRWDEIAVLLLDRAKEGDDEALLGLLGQAADLPSDRVEREWGTFLAYAYRRLTVPTLEALSRLTLRDRRVAADLIVSATLGLYRGDYDGPSTPWPSARIPADLVTRKAELGWAAVLSAERTLRNRVLASDVRKAAR